MLVCHIMCLHDADSAGAVAAATGSYGGGPWIWLGGNSCQASAEAIAGMAFNHGAFAAADAQACMLAFTQYCSSTFDARDSIVADLWYDRTALAEG